jgi:hypothetical protein
MDPRQQNQNGNNRGILSAEQPAQKQETPAAPKGARERKFRVMETTTVSRGASHYVLTAGKTISSLGYNIEQLEKHGVKLTEVTAPA